MQLNDIKTIYFVGIGGIGMSALARYFNGRGVAVHGYDRTSTPLTVALEAEGMHIHYQEAPELIPDQVDLVVYTPAVPNTHRELQYFKTHGFPIKKRAEVLGIISRSKKTVAIAGTHGKTTTSSITAHLLQEGGLDCTAFLGGIAQNYGSNYIDGQSEWVVVEADEFDRSFLHLSPDLSGILSMDADHLDIYGDAQSLLETGFQAFAKKRKPGGKLWVQQDFVSDFSGQERVASFGLETGTYRAEQIRVEGGYFCFDYTNPNIRMKDLRFTMPGRHNVENATLAITIALELGISETAIRKGLQNFKGIQRRFELVYRDEEIAFYDDYAHHPTELKAAINAARALFPERKITGVFQPHLFSRTRDFADGFAEALSTLDELLLLDIYPARELPIEGVTSDWLAQKIKNTNVHRVQLDNALDTIKKKVPEVLLTLGAGDISTLVPQIKQYLTKRKAATLASPD
ncbi:MAG TPA: UDP-N-acetylmuramate--L-alanine ligase [Saprospiraceae bacterium]|nr:UDP-N-acetylmuramate--L-alanine ligase [Saprospiraceae bacterium]